jgi:nucleotide-binding universal stress UspA family protein
VAAGTVRAARKLQDESSFHGIAVLVLQKGGQKRLLQIVEKEIEMITVQQIAEGAKTRTPANKRRLFKNILLATDFSRASGRALEYAVSLARRYGSAIYLTHIISLDGYPLIAPELAASSLQKLHVEATENFRGLLKSGLLMALPYKTVIQEGNLWPSLEELIKKYEIDLLVVGTRGAGAVRKVLIGSGAEEIFRKAKVPVLTVGPSTAIDPLYEVEFKNILFATDFGKSAEREAEYALSLAQEHCSRLRFVHVFPHPEAYGESVMALEKQNSMTQMRELVPAETELRSKLDFEVSVGDPVEQILRIAQETKADLIVMGAKARKNFAGNVPHTKAYRVVSAAPCPVLTVRS